MREKEKLWRGSSSISQDALFEHGDIEFCVEEGDEDDDGQDWASPPGIDTQTDMTRFSVAGPSGSCSGDET